MSSGSISCSVIRGRIEEDGKKRTSLVFISVEAENKPPTKKLIPPLMDMTGINVVNLLVDPTNVPKIRAALMDVTTPTPSDTGLQFKLCWNSDIFSRSNPLDVNTNDTGHVTPVATKFSLLGLVPLVENEGEMTIAFINQFPSCYSSLDRVEFQTAVMNDEFEKFQALRPTSHVILYIHTPIHEVYASLIKDFDTYWKKVVPMESFMFFTNDCCGKKIVDVIQPVQYSISSTVLFTSTFILNDLTKNPNTFDQIKKRNWQGSNYTAIDVISNKENAKNTIVVCVNDSVNMPFNKITLSSKSPTFERVHKSFPVTEIVLTHPAGDMVDFILLNEKKDEKSPHKDKHAFVTENLPFILSLKMKGILVPYFSMIHEFPSLPSVRFLLDHLMDTLYPSFYMWLAEFDQIEYNLQRKKSGATTTAPRPRPMALDNIPSLAPLLTMTPSMPLR